jgi:MFS family permease
VFGLHGGLVADRSDRRRTMVVADVARGAFLVPIAAAGLAGRLDLWMLVVAAFALETATSYFEPAYGALLPTLVERRNVQTANGLVRATAEAVRVGGWAAAAVSTVFFGAAATLPLVGIVALAAVRGRRSPSAAAAAPARAPD